MYGKTSACASIDRSIVYMLSQIGNMDVLQGKMRGAAVARALVPSLEGVKVKRSRRAAAAMGGWSWSEISSFSRRPPS